MASSSSEGAMSKSIAQIDLTENKFDGTASLLQSFENSLEETRKLITCRICMRPLFEPYVINCGHTFCYGCLARWFERDRRKKTCPDCRSDVVQPPAPSYLVRDITQIFTSRPELLSPSETTEEYEKWRQEEAALVEKDRSTLGRKGGLFRGCFKGSAREPRRLASLLRTIPIRDEEDGVDRCPRCTWELEDGLCESCGYPSGEETDFMSVSDGPELGYNGAMERDALDEEAIAALSEDGLHAVEFDTIVGQYGGEYGSDRTYSTESEGELGSPRRTRLDSPHRPFQRDRLAPPNPTLHVDSQTDEGSDDEEDAESLDSFIVGDGDDYDSENHSLSGTEPVGSVYSNRDVHWESEGSRSQGQSPNSESNAVIHHPNALENESDQEPLVANIRRRARRRAADSMSAVDDDFDVDAEEEPQTGWRRITNSPTTNLHRNSASLRHLNRISDRPRQHNNDTEADSQTSETFDRLNSSSTGVPNGPRTRSKVRYHVLSESDSDSPVRPQDRRSRRRANFRHPLSDANDDPEAGASTATIRRQSPPLHDRNLTDNSNSLPFTTSSPILTAPGSPKSEDNEDLYPGVPGAFPPSTALPDPPTSSKHPPWPFANNVNHQPLERTSTLNHASHDGRPQIHRQRTYPTSSGPRASRSPNDVIRSETRSDASESFQRGMQHRRRQRAEHERRKAERESRRRGVSPSIPMV